MQWSNYAIAVLNVADILDRRSPKDTKLSRREKRILDHGIKFLELALQGQEIASRSTSLAPSLDSLDSLQTYSFASGALRHDKHEIRKPDMEASKELFIEANEILSSLLQDIPISDLPSHKFEKTRLLFKKLADFAVAHTTSENEESEFNISDAIYKIIQAN